MARLQCETEALKRAEAEAVELGADVHHLRFLHEGESLSLISFSLLSLSPLSLSSLSLISLSHLSLSPQVSQSRSTPLSLAIVSPPDTTCPPICPMSP